MPPACDGSAEMSRVVGAGTREEDQKKRLKELVRRWHPDKWCARLCTVAVQSQYSRSTVAVPSRRRQAGAPS
eukprot:1178713-Prorocentrum_minimum.AAC.2